MCFWCAIAIPPGVLHLPRFPSTIRLWQPDCVVCEGGNEDSCYELPRRVTDTQSGSGGGLFRPFSISAVLLTLCNVSGSIRLSRWRGKERREQPRLGGHRLLCVPSAHHHFRSIGGACSYGGLRRAWLSDQAFYSLHSSPLFFSLLECSFQFSTAAPSNGRLSSSSSFTGSHRPHAETERLWPWCCQNCHFSFFARPSCQPDGSAVCI